MRKLGIVMDFECESMKLSAQKKAKECHTNARLIAIELKKLGYDVKVVTGIYCNLPKTINHSWIEFEDKILETDCRQLREDCDIMPDEFCAVLDKDDFKWRYKEMEVIKERVEKLIKNNYQVVA